MTSLTLVRRIAARPSIVFEAMTTAEGLASWWGPEDLPVLAVESDVRVGGAYRVRFHAQGVDHEACGEFLELVPPRRIVMSWRFSLGGEPDEVGKTSRIEIDLTPTAGGTEVTFTHVGLASETSKGSHTRGWTGSLDKLVRQMKHANHETEGGP